MIFMCKDIYAEDVEVGDELDFDGDEYCDNEFAIFGYAKVMDKGEFYQDKEPWVKLRTGQGTFEIPAGHMVRVKIQE